MGEALHFRLYGTTRKTLNMTIYKFGEVILVAVTKS